MTLPLAITDLGGTGPALLLGPSLGTAARTLWAPAAELLVERFHVLAWDLPGHGASPTAAGFTVADLAAALRERVDGPFGYAGVSVGGAVGLELLLQDAERVEFATLISTGARIGTPAAWRQRAAKVRAEGTGWLVDESPERWFAPGNRDTAIAQALLGDLAATDAASYAATCDALAAFDVRDRLAEITVPLLAVAGAHDPVTTPATLRHVAEGVQHGRLAVLDDASHQAPAEAPSAVAQLVADAAQWRPAGTSVEQLRAAGMRVRREVLGDAHVDRASAQADDLTAEFQQFITRYAWGSIWTRPGLDRRSRSLITLTALVARGHHDELAMHLRAARRNGLSTDEIKELLLQTAIYCGVPDANTAFRIAQRVFAEEDDE
ncbi:MAG TPA: 4-carboxymuconolactone decarboxylase [Jatrophihabitans sp.]|nr:4-carboxymuconolactone decarboxylase [Jatrophihabitans sp.]